VTLLSRVVAFVVVLGAPSLLAAQGRTCDIELPNYPDTRQTSYALPSGAQNVFLGVGVHAVCRRDRLSIRADSAEYYGDEKRLFLVGHVIYEEPRVNLTSDYLTYFGVDERVIASSNVNVRLPTGTTMVGTQAEYLRAYAARPTSVLTAIGRPTITLVEETAPGAKPEPPTTVLATTVVVLADSLIHGTGQVEITRPDLVARGDSAFIDSGSETMRLMRTPSIEGRRARPYRLAGETIDLFSRKRQLLRVVSRGAATALSEDMTLSSDTIDQRVADDMLQEAIAWGRSRARAKSSTQDIVADSIRVDMPAQRVRPMYALRDARAEAAPDSTRFTTTERDWLRGDTLVAHFDSTAPPAAAGDSASRPRIERLRAAGDARSYYHLAASDSVSRRPAINYVKGSVITVTFDTAGVQVVRVEGQSHGVYLEPASDTASATPAAPGQRPAPGTPTRPRPAVPLGPARPAGGRP
jgi:hypothetical protein